jgi:hypothetical protein
MNSEPNTIPWEKGSVVVHDSDLKQPRALMRITGYTTNGQAKCRYISKKKPKTVYKNLQMNLLDPAQFGLNARWGELSEEELEEVQTQWERAQMWNVMNQVGQTVLVVDIKKISIEEMMTDVSVDETNSFRAVTSSRAYMNKAGKAMVDIDKNSQSVLLDYIVAIKG